MSGHPHMGQIVYGGSDQTDPWMVVGRVETSVLLVPVGTELRSTHKGNVYNAEGEMEWRE